MNISRPNTPASSSSLAPLPDSAKPDLSKADSKGTAPGAELLPARRDNAPALRGKHPRHHALRDRKGTANAIAENRAAAEIKKIKAKIVERGSAPYADNSQNRLLLVEALSSLQGSLGNEEAQALIKQLRTDARVRKPTEEALLEPQQFRENIYRILLGTKHLQMQYSTKVDLHGCSHKLAPVLTSIALEKTIKTGFPSLEVIHGIGRHGKQNVGRMRDIALDTVSAPKYKNFVQEIKTDLNKAEDRKGKAYENVGGTLYVRFRNPRAVVSKLSDHATTAPLDMEELSAEIKKIQGMNAEERDNAVLDLADRIVDLDPRHWKEGFAVLDRLTYARLSSRIASRLAARMKQLGSYGQPDFAEYRKRFQQGLCQRSDLSECLCDYLEGKRPEDDIFAEAAPSSTR